MTVTRSRQVSESSGSRAYREQAARLVVAADKARRAARRQRDRESKKRYRAEKRHKEQATRMATLLTLLDEVSSSTRRPPLERAPAFVMGCLSNITQQLQHTHTLLFFSREERGGEGAPFLLCPPFLEYVRAVCPAPSWHSHKRVGSPCSTKWS